MTIDLDTLEAAAKAATPGPWKESLYPFFIQAGDYQLANITSKNAGDDSAYIAAANPAVVLELIAALRETRAELKRCTSERRWLADYLSANAGPDWRRSAYEYLALAKQYAKVEES